MISVRNNRLNRTSALAFAFLLPFFSFGAETRSTYFSNALFNTLLVVIILLAIFVIGLAGALKAVIGSDLFIEKLKRDKAAASKKGLMLLVLLSGSLALSAQAPEKVADAAIGGLDQPVFYTMCVIIALEVIVLGILIQTFKKIAGQPEAKKAVPAKKSKPVLDVINATVPIEEEEKITLDHVYDGIRELDNDLPPWWKYGLVCGSLPPHQPWNHRSIVASFWCAAPQCFSRPADTAVHFARRAEPGIPLRLL